MKGFGWLIAAVLLAGTALPAWAQLTANGTPDSGSSNNGNSSNGNSNNGAGGNGATGNGLPDNNGGGPPKQSINMNVSQIKAQSQAPINGGNIASENTGQSGSQLPQMKQAGASSAPEPVPSGPGLGSTVGKTNIVQTGVGKGKTKNHKFNNGSKFTKSLPSMKQVGASSASVTAPAKPFVGTVPRPVMVAPGNNNPPPH